MMRTGRGTFPQHLCYIAVRFRGVHTAGVSPRMSATSQNSCDTGGFGGIFAPSQTCPAPSRSAGEISHSRFLLWMCRATCQKSCHICGRPYPKTAANAADIPRDVSTTSPAGDVAKLSQCLRMCCATCLRHGETLARQPACRRCPGHVVRHLRSISATTQSDVAECCGHVAFARCDMVEKCHRNAADLSRDMSGPELRLRQICTSFPHRRGIFAALRNTCSIVATWRNHPANGP
jgi:hypothetical protein